ncbi:MAG: hypothetical protein QXK37_00385 [Candidatus Woesearchaeota archaeon]
MPVSYNAGKKNSRLTDFSELKPHVIANVVKNIPSQLKTKTKDKNSCLGLFV